MAVSKALRDAPDISVATKTRVQQEARRRNYIPNRAAQNLRLRKSGLIGVVVPQINLNWQHEFFYLVNGMSINVEWPDALYTGVGVTASYKKCYNASFFYNCYACNQDLISQNIFLSLGMTF